MWLRLHRDILEEFAALSSLGYHSRDFAYRLRVIVPAPLDPWAKARKLILKRRRLLRARVEVAAARPPCPNCGGAVERLGTTGTPPKYCSRKCMQTAKRKRFEGKQVAA